MAVLGIEEVKGSDVARFWAYVNKEGPGGCWLWTGGGSSAGGSRYGVFWVCNRSVGAHFFSYLIHSRCEKVPRSVMVLHECDRKLCVNPAHLFLGTTQVNMDDMKAKGRQCRGSRAAKSKLRADQVLAIRRDYASGKATVLELAKAFGVSDTAIRYILERRNWKHI